MCLKYDKQVTKEFCSRKTIMRSIGPKSTHKDQREPNQLIDILIRFTYDKDSMQIMSSFAS